MGKTEFKSLKLRFYPTKEQKTRLGDLFVGNTVIYNLYVESHALSLKAKIPSKPLDPPTFYKNIMAAAGKNKKFMETTDVRFLKKDHFYSTSILKTLESAAKSIRATSKQRKALNFRSLSHNPVRNLFMSGGAGFFVADDKTIYIKGFGDCAVRHGYTESELKDKKYISLRILKMDDKYYILLLYTKWVGKIKPGKFGCSISFDFNRYCTIYFEGGEVIHHDSFVQYPRYQMLYRKYMALRDSKQRKFRRNYKELLESYRQEHGDVQIPYADDKKMQVEAYNTNNIRKLEKRMNKIRNNMIDIMLDFMHNIITKLVKLKPAFISLYDFNSYLYSDNASEGSSLSSLLNKNYYKFKTILLNMCREYDIELRVVNREYLSLFVCSNCGNVDKDIVLEDKMYVCNNCNSSIDAGINNAINLYRTTNYTKII